MCFTRHDYFLLFSTGVTGVFRTITRLVKTLRRRIISTKNKGVYMENNSFHSRSLLTCWTIWGKCLDYEQDYPDRKNYLKPRISTWRYKQTNETNDLKNIPLTQCFLLKERHPHFLYTKLKAQSVMQLFFEYLWFLNNNSFLVPHIVLNGGGISSI